MTANLLVLNPGLNATIQDFGRPGFQSLGVPVSGALDPVALRITNWLVGNDGGEGAIEMRFSGPAFEVCGGPVRIALAGDGAAVTLMPEERAVPAYRSVTLQPGQRFRVLLKGGGACYLAVAGGIAVAPELGSIATLAAAQIGGLEGRPLAAGDRLPLRQDIEGGTELMLRPPKLDAPEQLRVILGPQDDYFFAETITDFLTQAFTVSHLSNRIGLRLEGEPLRHSKGSDIISDGNVTGAIQVPGSGQPIILLADCGTTGGYPKIATVISADLPALGRLPPGATVRFEAVGQAQAVAALRAQNAWLESMKRDIHPCAGEEASLTKALFEENIISGVADAHS